MLPFFFFFFPPILTQGLVPIDFERERERERNIDWLSPIYAPTRDLTYNPSMCPDQESNLQPFGVQGNAPTN